MNHFKIVYKFKTLGSKFY